MEKKVVFCLCFVLISLFSCHKQELVGDIQPDNMPGLRAVVPSVVRIDASPLLAGSIQPITKSTSGLNKLSSSFGGPLATTNAIGHTIGLVHIDNDYFWNEDKAGRTFEGLSDEQVILPETALDIIYPGSILKGNTVDDQSSIVPVDPSSYTPKPIEVSATIAARKVYDQIAPDYASFENFKQRTLAQEVPSEQNMSFKVDIKTFMNYNELKYLFGSNAKVNALFFSNTSGSSADTYKVTRKTGLMMKYTQENFTVDISTPEPGELYEHLDPSGLNGASPVYVSTVTYGRMGILVAESDNTSEDVAKAFQSAFNAFGIVGGSKSITESERSIINSATMKVYLAGVRGGDAVKVINGFEEFVSLIKNGKFSKNAPGVPISFKMRYLTNHQIVKTPFQINIAFDQVFLEVKGLVQNKLGAIFFAYADINKNIPVMLPSKFEVKHKFLFFWSPGGTSSPQDSYVRSIVGSAFNLSLIHI